MRKILLSLTLVLLYSNSYSQKVSDDYKNWGFVVSIEQRITPIYLSGLQPGPAEATVPVFYNEDQQLSGTVLDFGVYYNFERIDLLLKFEQDLRYDQIYFDTGVLGPITNQVNPAVNGLIIDYHFSLEKRFRIKNGIEISIEAGYSFMNHGTDYSYTRQVGESPVGPIYSTTTSSFSFTAFNFSTGMKRDNITWTLGSYISDYHEYNEPSEILIPYVKLGYDIRMKKK